VRENSPFLKMGYLGKREKVREFFERESEGKRRKVRESEREKLKRLAVL
jgi:hypothetical protein